MTWAMLMQPEFSKSGRHYECLCWQGCRPCDRLMRASCGETQTRSRSRTCRHPYRRSRQFLELSVLLIVERRPQSVNWEGDVTSSSDSDPHLFIISVLITSALFSSSPPSLVIHRFLLSFISTLSFLFLLFSLFLVSKFHLFSLLFSVLRHSHLLCFFFPFSQLFFNTFPLICALLLF